MDDPVWLEEASELPFGEKSLSAVENLKAKLQNLGKPLSELAYSFDSIALAKNPDWNPLDHPKDHEGKFVKKSHGTFLFGKWKTAVFTTAAGTAVSTNVEPGHKKTHVKKVTGTEWLVDEDPDGNKMAQTVDPTTGSLGEPQPVGQHSAMSDVLNPNQPTPSHLKVVKQKTAPASPIKALSEAEAKQKLNDPTGKKIIDLGGGNKTFLEPNQEAFHINEQTVIVTDGEVDEVFYSNGLKVPDDAVNQEVYLNAVKQEGKKVDGETFEGTPDEWEEQLQEWEKELLEPGEVPDGPDPLTEEDPSEAPKAQSDFTHPVSGQSALTVVEVHQHKKSKNSYLVKTQSGSWLFFDKNGNAKPASQKLHLQHLDKNYDKLENFGPSNSASKSVGEEQTDYLDHTWVKTAPNQWEPDNAPMGSVTITDAEMDAALKPQEDTKEPEKPEKPESAPKQDQFTLPNGVVVDMLPGTTVYESGGSYTVFNPDGSGVKYYASGKTSNYVGKKAHYKHWNVAADNPLPKLKSLNLSDVKPESVDGAWYIYTGKKRSELADLLQVTGYGHVQADSPLTQHYDSGGALDLLASKKFRDLVDTAAITLKELPSKDSSLGKGDKLAIGKDRSRFELLANISRFAADLKNPDADEYDLDVRFAVIMARLGDKHNTTFGKMDFPVPKSIAHHLDNGMKSWKFKKQTSDLPFDPDDAPLETLHQYAAAEGFGPVGGLTEDLAKNWVKLHLGDPSASGAGSPDAHKKGILDQAQYNLTAAGAAVFLKSAGASKSQEHEDAKTKALEAQKKTLNKQAKNMVPSYSGPKGQLLSKSLVEDEWVFHDENNQVTHVTQSSALELVAKHALSPNKVSLQAELTQFEEQIGGPLDELSTKQLNAAIAERGGKYLGKMSAAGKQQWLRAEVVGDEALQYKLEHDAAAKGTSGTLHKDHETHAGSWGSPQGKAYRQSLADYVASLPSSSDMTDEQLNEATAVLGLDSFAFALNADLANHNFKKLAFEQFILSRGDLPAPSYDPQDLQDTQDVLTAPPGIKQSAWDMVLAAEKGSPESVEMLKDVSGSFSYVAYGVTPLSEPFIPESLKKLAVWAQAGPTSLAQQRMEVSEALTQRFPQLISPSTPKWTDPKGKVWPLAPGTKVLVADDLNYVVTGDGDAYYFAAWSNSPHKLNEASDVPDDAQIVMQAPAALTFDQAKQKGLKSDKFTWDAVDNFEKAEGETKLPGVTGISHAIVLHSIQNSPAVSDVLKANISKLPEKTQKLVAWAATNDAATLDAIEFKLKSGHYATEQLNTLFDPTTPHGKAILAGNVSAVQVNQNWTPQAMDSFGKKYGVAGDYSPVHAVKIAEKLTELFSADVSLEELTETKATSALPTKLNLTPLSKSLGGMHSKQAWTDQDGNEWMSKAFPNDPNSKARVDAEHQANVIGRMFGFRNPETRVMTLGGNYSYVQHLKPATGSLMSKGPGQLSDESLAQAMEEHVLDWLVSNHDSHPDNLLTDPDGSSIIGIDKGQAWRFFPSDKLAVGYKASNPVHVWYDQFYKAVQSGSIDKKRADYVTRRVLKKALKVQDKLDEQFTDALQNAHKNRTSFPPEYPTREDFIEAILDRKKQLASDFHSFYGKLYKDAGWQFDFDLDAMSGGGKLGDAHLGVSQEFAEEVKVSGAQGKSVFFATQDIEDAHALVWTESHKGVKMARGEMRIRANADAVISAWLAQQSVANEVGHTSHSMNVPSAPQHELLPHADDWYAQIVAGAKTVNHHVGDGEYNEGTLDQMASIKAQMVAHLSNLEAFEAKSPDKPFNLGSFTFVTKEQQDAWKTMLGEYVEAINHVQEAKDNQIKTKKPAVELASYKASKDLDTENFIPNMSDASEPEQNDLSGLLEKLEESPVVYIEWNGDTYDVTPEPDDGDGPFWNLGGLPSEFFEAHSETKSAMADPPPELFAQLLAKYPHLAPDLNVTQYLPDIEAESLIEVEPGKTIKVIKRKAYGTHGSYDEKTGELKYLGKLTDGHTGYQYDIEYGDVSITYRPWNSTDGVAKAQQGLLRFTIDNWDGDSAALEDVFETLEDIGLDVTPADETSMEIFYWRQLFGVMQDRKGGTQGDYGKTVKAIKDAFGKNPDMTPEEELDMLRSSFKLSMGKDKVDNADWYPKFSRFRVYGQKDNPGATTGHPHWHRPDVTLAELKKVYGSTTLVSSAASGNLGKMAATGGALSTEERLRVLGQFLTGMSSGSDQGHGSSNFVFTRQNLASGTIYYHPKVALRTSNYSFAGDNFGEIKNRKNGAPFNALEAAKFSAGGNETMIKYGTSFLDDVAAVVFGSAAHRDSAVKLYKDNGITSIQGLPIEEVFVTSNAQAAKARAKVWDQALDEETKTAVLDAAQKAVYAALVGSGKSPAEALKEAKAS